MTVRTQRKAKPTRVTRDVAARIAAHRDEILALAQKHGATNLRVFGSFVHGTMTKTSDLDLLVEFEPRRSLLDLIGLQQDLEALLGVSVDVATAEALHRLIRDEVLRDAQPL
jgi:predicted nucleotidyltransferase